MNMPSSFLEHSPLFEPLASSQVRVAWGVGVVVVVVESSIVSVVLVEWSWFSAFGEMTPLVILKVLLLKSL